MIVVILAGGYATRLFPLTRNVAKPLLHIRGRPIIDYIFDKLERLTGIDKVMISTNKKFERHFEEWLARRPRGKVVIWAEESHVEGEKLGAIRALGELIDEIDSEDYLVIAGDNFFTSDLGDLVAYYHERNSAVIVTYDVKDIDVVKSCSIAEVGSDGKLVRFVEKPKRPESTLIGTCIYLFPRNSIRRIHEYLSEGNNPDSPGNFIGWLCEKEPVYGYALQGRWWDVGTPRSYDEAKRTWHGT